MKKIFLFSLVALSLNSFAGGIGSGGGGTVSKPATPDQIAEAVRKYAGVINQIWLQEKQTLNDEGVDHGAFKPVQKIFASTTDVYKVLHNTKVELRMNSACADADGSPVDGSIYASQLGAICLSPFSMAPKLNQQNYVNETVALVLHEMSHLVGLNEDEAVELQTAAVKDFSPEDLDQNLLAVAQMGSNGDDGSLAGILSDLDSGIQDPGSLSGEKMKSILDSWSLVNQVSTHGNFLLLPANLYYLQYPQFTNFGAVEDYVCYNDSAQDQEARANCRQEFDRGFGKDRRVTARTFQARASNADPKIYRPEYDQVFLDKPVRLDDIPAGLAKTQTFLSDLQNTMKDLAGFQLSTYSN